MPRSTPRQGPRTRGQNSGAAPHPVDVHVGERVRFRRCLLKLSQQALADKLGLSFQQVQKYEKGANRIGAGRLFEIATILHVEPNYFFDELPTDVRRKLIDRLTTSASRSDSLLRDQQVHDATTLEENAKEIARLWLMLPNERAREVAISFLSYCIDS